MPTTKGLSSHFSLPFLCLSLVIASCGGSKAPPTTPSEAKVEPIRVEIPQKVDAENRNRYLPILLQLPVEHPQRVELRDALVRSYAAEFQAAQDEDVIGRMKLFEGAMLVHASADFAPERVSAFAMPMARWVTQHLAKQGNEPAVLSALRFLMLAEPGKVEHKERYFELSEWSQAARETMASPAERDASRIDLYRQMLMLVPDRDIAVKLCELYVRQHKELSFLVRERNRGRFDMGQIPDDQLMQRMFLTPHYVVHAMFLVGDPAGARRFLEPLVGNTVENSVLTLLDKVYQRIDIASAYYDLARFIELVDRNAALRAAFLARAEDPENALYSLYIGQLFDILELPECSTDFYAEVSRLAPDDEDLLSKALELARRAMLSVHFAEKTQAARYAVKVGDAMVEKARPMLAKVDDSSPMPFVVASFFYSMGDVEFDDGQIDDALRHYKASHKVLPDSQALLRISEIQFMRGQAEAALTLVEQAAAKLKQAKNANGYFEASLEERRGDVLFALGRKEDAMASWRRSLSIWRAVDRTSDHASTAALRRGVLLDRLGDPRASADEFRLAIRLDPESRGTYADILSFLVLRQRLDDAEGFYRLAYNQDQIAPMWKIYYSMWVEGLAMRAKPGGRSELARAYLEQSDGKTWQDNLAAFFVGKLSVDELLAKAVNRGQKVEVEYYSALLDLAGGKREDARVKLQRVLDSDLMGFFEYRMARSILVDQPAPK
ncbi:MAG: hypothetical protein MUC50_09740 [Myxococcota bacterium]|jgi:tetratricopeptide (TPR) repeat protein|nr:hypothetical protein [Myxococcota bacterium]